MDKVLDENTTKICKFMENYHAAIISDSDIKYIRAILKTVWLSSSLESTQEHLRAFQDI